MPAALCLFIAPDAINLAMTWKDHLFANAKKLGALHFFEIAGGGLHDRFSARWKPGFNEVSAQEKRCNVEGFSAYMDVSGRALASS
jgi:hypothetical protein